MTDAKLKEVEQIAKAEVPPGVPMAQWALAWCLEHPAVSAVIPGCKDVQQVINNAQAANAGTYTAHVTDSKGCITSCEATLIVNPNPTCTVSPPTATICEGLTQTFTANPSGGTGNSTSGFCVRNPLVL